MKHLNSYFALIIIASIFYTSFSQEFPSDCTCTIPNSNLYNVALDGFVATSSVADGSIWNSHNGNPESGYTSGTEQESQWEIDLGKPVCISTIQIYFIGDESIDYYISINDIAYGAATLDQVLSQSQQTHHVNAYIPSGSVFPIAQSGRYLRIQKNGYGILGLGDVQIFAYKEICGNGIDNDCDGLIDCNDSDCQPDLFNITKVDPSCPICQDGKICIQVFVFQPHNKSDDIIV